MKKKKDEDEERRKKTYHKFWHICCCCWCIKFVSHELGLLAKLLSVVESALVCDGNDIWFVDMVDGLNGRALLACCKKSVSILKTAVWLFSCCSKSVVIGIKFWFAGAVYTVCFCFCFYLLLDTNFVLWTVWFCLTAILLSIDVLLFDGGFICLLCYRFFFRFCFYFLFFFN